MLAVSRTLARLGLATMVALLGACTDPNAMETRVSAATPIQTAASRPTATLDAPFPRSEAETLFSYGFSAINDRYIDAVNLRDLVLEGLRGLTTLDPALAFRPDGDFLEISRAGQAIGTFRMPGTDDSAGWGLLTATVFALVRADSIALADAEPEVLYEAVFDSALTQLDPFSRYAGRDEASLNRGARNGFGGIGVMYEAQADGILITRVLPSTPASEAGLREGDRILRIDGEKASGMTRGAVRNALRGPTSSAVRLDIHTATGRVRTVSLERALIVMPTVDMHYEDGVAFIAVSSFNQRTTTHVAEAISDAKRQHGAALKGLVLDLRGNPGGLLDQAVTMSDLFMEHGAIVSTRGRHPDARQYYAATAGDLARTLPIVVLVDGDSASAAEIVAAALQDSGRAVVIGTSSYGKGTVQTVIQLPNGGEMTLTWSRFHSPSGYVLHGLGVLPVACTSGTHDLDGILATVRDSQADLAARIALWRSTDFRDQTGRMALRNNCPAEHHQKAMIDEAVARRLIADRSLYSRALRLAAPEQAAGTYLPRP